MGHSIHRVISFELLDSYVLSVHFEDGTSQTIDFQPVLKGELFGPLSNPIVFQKVSIDKEIHTLVWPNGADFDPETLHDWPTHEPSLKEMASRWESALAENT